MEEIFQEHRPLLFSIAYRMLGSATEAEDIVQDAFLRYQAAQSQALRSPRAFLSTVVTRLCLDQLKSARATRERYIGPWLPEPLLTGGDMFQRVEQRESVSMAMLILLERLTPQERAVFVLREAFEFPYQEIAAAIELSVANCRQLFHRAQQNLAAGRARFRASPEEHRHIVERFLAATRQGDLQALTALLAGDVVNWSDGGGKVSAARQIIMGSDHVGRFIIGATSKLPAGTHVELAEVNGQMAILIWVDGILWSVTGFQIAGGQVLAIYTSMNPNKLAFLQRQHGAFKH